MSGETLTTRSTQSQIGQYCYMGGQAAQQSDFCSNQDVSRTEREICKRFQVHGFEHQQEDCSTVGPLFPRPGHRASLVSCIRQRSTRATRSRIGTVDSSEILISQKRIPTRPTMSIPRRWTPVIDNDIRSQGGCGRTSKSDPQNVEIYDIDILEVDPAPIEVETVEQRQSGSASARSASTSRIGASAQRQHRYPNRNQAQPADPESQVSTKAGVHLSLSRHEVCRCSHTASDRWRVNLDAHVRPR
jgi:hypothetical protein